MGNVIDLTEEVNNTILELDQQNILPVVFIRIEAKTLNLFKNASTLLRCTPVKGRKINNYQ